MSVELAGGGSYFGIIGVTLGEEPRGVMALVAEQQGVSLWVAIVGVLALISERS